MENETDDMPITWDELDLEEWLEDADSDNQDHYQELADRYGIESLQVAKISCAVWWADPAEGGGVPQALDLVRQVAREITDDQVVMRVIQDDTGIEFQENVNLETALTQLPDLLKKRHERGVGAVGNLLRRVGFEVFRTGEGKS